MTFRSNAAEHERDQLGTNKSAGRVLSFVEVSPQLLSSSGARQALRQKSAKLSRRWLCLVTTSPPAWHIRAWCPWMSRVGKQCGQASASVKTGSRATISLRLGLQWAAGLTPILEMAVPSAMHVLGEQRWLVVWPCLLWMLHQAKKGSQLFRWLRIACADAEK